MFWRAAPVLLVTIALVAGCTAHAEPPAPPGDTPVVKAFVPTFGGKPDLPPADMTDNGPGSLVSVEPVTGNDDLDNVDAAVLRIVYRSTSGIDGSPTEVSGIVAIPPGTPPPGGWPIISFGHGTTGVLTKCAPSLYPSLVGAGFMISNMVLGGFAVTMTDDQGLGVKGYYHPFLDSKTSGNNMIDAVRATRRLGPQFSDRWVAFGHSLGGMAAWAAADRAGTYGQGLNLVATLAMAPVADMAGLADDAQNGTLSKEQLVAMVYLLQSLSWSHPDLDLNRYRSGYTAAHWDQILDCIPPNLDDIAKVRSGMQESDLKPETPADTARLRDLLEGMALPKDPITGPMLVVYGTADTLVDYRWTEQALYRACAQGDTIEIEKRIGQGHSDLESAQGLPWIKDRMDGQAPINSCPAQS